MGLIQNFLILSTIGLVICDHWPRVETPLGTVEGFYDETTYGRTIYSFEGIPYGMPPTGKNRFKAPIPREPWRGVWKADVKFACLQYNHLRSRESDRIDGIEDCLYVNVYTPELDGNLDVIVFIHGGGFTFGAGAAYGPKYLLNRNVVLVTINYRLGPLGFLSTEDDVAPGNNGLKDQILALKWIQDNIEYFGGNPNSVTITGMSAGGASVHFHMLSEKSKGLFHRGISSSGCMLNPWVLAERPLETAKELASYVGCRTDNTELMVECLTRKPGKQIVKLVKKFQPWLYNPFSPFAIVVDKWASDPLLPKHPLQLLQEKQVAEMPWMISHTTDEGIYPAFDFYREEDLEYIDKHWNEVMPHILHYNHSVSPSEIDRVSSEIRREYFGGGPVNRENFYKLVDAIGDRLFKVDMGECAKMHAAAVTSPVYYYVFDYRGAHSVSEYSGSKQNLGVSHGDDTSYILDFGINSQSTTDDRTMSSRMMDYFVNFAKNGSPISSSEWPDLSKDTKDAIIYARLGSEGIPTQLTTDTTEHFGNRDFWKSLPFQENENLFVVPKDEL